MEGKNNKQPQRHHGAKKKAQLPLAYKEILAQFGLDGSYAIWPIQPGVFKVSAPKGEYCLKLVPYGPEKSQFLYDIMTYLYEKGFFRISKPVATLEGACGLASPEGYYTMNRWVGGIPCVLDNEFHLQAAGRCLGAFSCAAQGGTLLPGGKVGYHQWGERFAQRTEDLCRWDRELRQKHKRNPWEQLYLKVAPGMIRDGVAAENLLKHSAYAYLADEALYYRTFVHRDVAARNFIIGADGEGWLIDFDYCRYDLPLTDIVRFVERGLKAVVYTPRQLDHMVASYDSIRPIDREEYRVISAMLLFPQKFWRLSERYFADPKTALKQGAYYKLIQTLGQMKEHKDIWIYFQGKYGCR